MSSPNLRESVATAQSRKIENNIKIEERAYQIHYALFALIAIIWIILFRVELNLGLSKDFLISLTNFQENWSSAPILDILSTDKLICPQGYEPLINDNFHGINKGCYCPESGDLFPETCEKIQGLEEHCDDVHGVGKEVFKVYRRKTLCAKRMSKNYFDFELKEGKAVEKKSCGEGKKKCGILDSKDNILCLSEDQPCPINGIYFAESEDDPYFDSFEKNDFKFVELGDDKKLAFTNKHSSGRVIVEFKFEDDFPCINPFYYNSKTSFSSFILHPYYSRDQCVAIKKNLIFDDRYYQVDKYSLDLLLKENKILDKIEKLPGFKQRSLISPVYLYSRSYIFMERKCLKQLNDRIEDQLDDDDYKFNAQFIEVLGRIFHNLYNKFYLVYMLILTYTFLEVMFYMVISKYLEEMEDTPRNWLGKVFSEGLCCLVLFLVIVVGVISMKKMYSVKKIFNFEECSDTYTNVLFSQFYSHLYYFYVENLLLIILGVLSFAGLCYSIVHYSKNYENEEARIDNNLKKMFELTKFE